MSANLSAVADKAGKPKKVLFINSTPKLKDESITLQMAYELLDSYKAANPEDEITTLNLYDEDIKFLDRETISQFLSGDQDKIEFIRYTKQFVEADRYIIAAPMWNLTVPAILSAYLDYTNIVGMTFFYTEHGPIGMLADKGKKAVFVCSRGGGYTEGKWEPYEMAERYVRKQFEFFGITDFQLVLMEWADALKGEPLEAAKRSSMERARQVGRAL